MCLRASDPVRAFARLILVAVAALAIAGTVTQPAQAATPAPGAHAAPLQAAPLQATVDGDQAVRVAQEPIREPVAGACIRPLVGEGGVLNLPLLDIPGKRLPNDSIEVTIGGQYRDCKMGGIGV
jgi:hypothetical protein